MINPLVYFQKDFLSLKDYCDFQCSGKYKIVTFEAVKRRLLIVQRAYNCEIPDHFYHLNNERRFNSADSLCDIFTKLFPAFSKEYLNFGLDNKISVKEEKFIEWGYLISNISPLFFQAVFLSVNKTCCWKNKGFDYNEIREIFNDYILPNSRYTAIPSPIIKPIEDIHKAEGGFYDLHIHLNGIEECDAVWLNLLDESDKNINNILQAARDKPEIYQQFEQTGITIEEDNLRSMLEKAKEIRIQLFNKLFSVCKNHQNKTETFLYPFSILIKNSKPDFQVPNKNLCYEFLMYYLVLEYLCNSKDEDAAMLLHEYLLINGWFSTLLQHDNHLFGFKQFQLITKNDIRANCDNNQNSKFLQINGNNLNFIKFTELRFSPKDSVDKNQKLIQEIDRAWGKMQDAQKCLNQECSNSQYRLIAHFIKKTDDKPDEYIRFRRLRTELEKKANALIALKNLRNNYSDLLIGIDAASSEFDTPPEVFAPVYKKLREEKIFSHFTFHAGEDFYHILDGLRTIYEAIIFLDLRNGDRIGHASATGTDIRKWAEIVGDNILIPNGIYLDNLVFAYHFITERKIECLYNKLPLLSIKIQKKCYEIYKKNWETEQIVEAWRCRNSELHELKENNEEVREILTAYNSRKNRNEYNKPIEINCYADFSESELEEFQLKLLEFMHEKEIVIEVNPTSNLRIGYHSSLSTYQLFRWYNWKNEGKAIPPIVLGSDDSGIFSTNIYNEYALIYCYLVHEKKQYRNDVIKFIEDICANSRIYAFR